ncbi:protein-disulfide reductase DsbD domain-containing protein [Novosphingobium sp.]|uniref:protein-disulfide reductase DsbD family protein n=1 Tax=Novosphingobium sp. TaxID=1874826 RepID=UPI0025F3A412|nr:protein-disulfide reductase DsbD domain-containing protein [Novosphingobium sp.]MCC6924565.1 thioredoxin family protein [Novosphingobium sp.]
MRRYRPIIAVVLQMLAMLLAAPALAAPSHIKAELVVEGPVAPGGEVTLAVLMKPEAGWHGYWQNPGDAGLGLTIDWTLPAGASTGALRYPTPETLLISGLMNHVYEHDYAVLVPLKVPATLPAGSSFTVRAKAQWLACTDKICVPERGELSAVVKLRPPGRGDPRFDQWRAALPAPLGSPATFAIVGGKVRVAVPLPAGVALERPHLFVADDRVVDYAAPQAFFRDGDRLVVELPRGKFEPVTPGALHAVLRLNQAGDGVSLEAAPGEVPTGGTPLAAGTEAAGLPWLLLSALLGGLLLNVMPCVFPILSLKALSLARAGESEAQARAEGLAYTAGVVLACLALGGLLLALRAGGEQVGWAFQLQEPLVVAGLLLLATAITANLLGLFEFAVPGFASEGSPQGAFATGLLAAFVATPCTGPFMAAAMGAALLLPVAPALALFGMLGLGLALPFLALAFVPALRRMLPRPGAWMDRFRKAMAVPMALTALALLWLASRVAGNGFALAAGLFALILIAVLVITGRRQRHGLAAGAPVWAALGVMALAFALGMPGMVRQPLAAEADLLGAQPFSQAALDKARATGKPVFVYFTADWCLTCKVNEKVALEAADTLYNFKRAGVIVLRGDWTRRDPAISRFLAAHGAAGVPLYLWYPPKGSAAQQLPQVLTPQLLGDLVKQTRTG